MMQEMLESSPTEEPVASMHLTFNKSGQKTGVLRRFLLSAYSYLCFHGIFLCSSISRDHRSTR